jgi:hypothetical protein
VVCPQIVSTDLDGLWLLGIFGETGLCRDLTTFSYPQKGQGNRAFTGRKFLYSHHGGAHALDFTKYAHEPNGMKLSSNTSLINKLPASQCDRAAVSRIGSALDDAGLDMRRSRW